MYQAERSVSRLYKKNATAGSIRWTHTPVLSVLCSQCTLNMNSNMSSHARSFIILDQDNIVLMTQLQNFSRLALIIWV